MLMDGLKTWVMTNLRLQVVGKWVVRVCDVCQQEEELWDCCELDIVLVAYRCHWLLYHVYLTGCVGCSACIFCCVYWFSLRLILEELIYI